MPALIADYQNKVMAVRVKKGYSQLENALKLYMVQNNCDNLLCLFDHKNKTTIEVTQELAAMFPGSEVCTENVSTKCKRYAIKDNSPTYKVDGKYASQMFYAYNGRILLPNGMSYFITLQDSNKECISEHTSTKRDEMGYDTGEEYTYVTDRCGSVLMDVNGYQSPNQFGADVYRFDIRSDGKKLYSFYQDQFNNAVLNGKVKYTKYNLGDEVKL